MIKNVAVLFVVLVILLIGNGAFALADVIVLKNGTRVEGEVIEDTIAGITVKMQYGEIFIPRADLPDGNIVKGRRCAVSNKKTIKPVSSKSKLMEKHQLNTKRNIKKYLRRVSKKDGMYIVDGKHWCVKTDVSANLAAETLVFMESFYTVFNRDFRVKAKNALPSWAIVSIKPSVVVYKHKSDYLDKVSHEYADTSGLFFPVLNRSGKCESFSVYTYLSCSNESDFIEEQSGVLQHEGTHALLQGFFGKKRIPVWFNEGLATYFEGWNVLSSYSSNNRLRRSNSLRFRNIKKYIKLSELKTHKLEILLSMTSKDWDFSKMEKEPGYYYLLAETFMDFMLNTQKGRRILVRLSKKIKKGEKSKSVLSKEEIGMIEPYWHEHVELLFRMGK